MLFVHVICIYKSTFLRPIITIYATASKIFNANNNSTDLIPNNYPHLSPMYTCVEWNNWKEKHLV